MPATASSNASAWSRVSSWGSRRLAERGRQQSGQVVPGVAFGLVGRDDAGHGDREAAAPIGEREHHGGGVVETGHVPRGERDLGVSLEAREPGPAELLAHRIHRAPEAISEDQIAADAVEDQGSGDRLAVECGSSAAGSFARAGDLTLRSALTDVHRGTLGYAAGEAQGAVLATRQRGSNLELATRGQPGLVPQQELRDALRRKRRRVDTLVAVAGLLDPDVPRRPAIDLVNRGTVGSSDLHRGETARWPWQTPRAQGRDDDQVCFIARSSPAAPPTSGTSTPSRLPATIVASSSRPVSGSSIPIRAETEKSPLSANAAAECLASPASVSSPALLAPMTAAPEKLLRGAADQVGERQRR